MHYSLWPRKVYQSSHSQFLILFNYNTKAMQIEHSQASRDRIPPQMQHRNQTQMQNLSMSDIQQRSRQNSNRQILQNHDMLVKYDDQPSSHSDDNDLKMFISKLVVLMLIPSLMLYVMTTTNRCLILGQDCEQKTKDILLVSSKFQYYQCFLIDYTKEITNPDSPNPPSVQNLSTYFCIKDIADSKDMQIIGYQKMQKNWTQNEELTLDSPLFGKSFSISKILTALNNKNSTITTGSSLSQLQTIIKRNVGEFVMFRFKISRNGTLGKIQFDKRNNNQTLSDLPKLIKLFFPKTSVKEYLQNIQNSTQITTFNRKIVENNSVVKNQNGIQLTTYRNETPSQSGPNIHSIQQITYKFDNEGILTESLFKGNATLSSLLAVPSVNLTHNISLQLSVEQKISMRINSIFSNLTQNEIYKFEEYFKSLVVDLGYSLAMSQNELQSYLLGYGSSSSTTRLLSTQQLMTLDDMPSNKLIDHNKSLLRSKIYGLDFKINAASKVNLTFGNNQNNRPYRQSEISTILEVIFGSFKQQHIVSQQFQHFGPLSLGITRSKIAAVMKVLNPDIILKLNQTAQIIPKNISSSSMAVPSQGLLSNLQNAKIQVDKVRTQTISANTTSTVLANIDQFYSQVKNYTQNLILAEKSKAQSLDTHIKVFNNATYVQQLRIFKMNSSDFFNQKINGTSTLLQMKTKTLEEAISYAKSVLSFNNKYLNSLYYVQSLNLKPVVEFYQYFNQETVALIKNLTTQVDIFTNGFNQTLKSFLQLFYELPYQSFNKLINFSSSVKTIITAQTKDINTGLSVSLSNGDIYLQQKLESIQDLYDVVSQANYLTNLNSSLNTILDIVKSLNTTIRTAASSKCGDLGDRFWLKTDPTFPKPWIDNMNEIFGTDSDITYLKSNTKLLNFLENYVYNYVVNIENLYKSSSPVLDKYISIKKKIASFGNIKQQVSTIELELTQFQQKMALLRDALQKDKICGYINNPTCCEAESIIGVMMVGLSGLIQQSTNVRNNLPAFYQVLDNVTLYNTLISSFNAASYQQIVLVAQIPQSAVKFENQNVAFIDIFGGLLVNVTNTKTNITHSYIMGQNIRQSISYTFTAFQNHSQMFCSQNTTKNNEILQIRNNFSAMLSQVNGLIDSDLLNKTFGELTATMQNFSKTAFSGYDPLNPCNSTINITVQNMSDLVTDTSNFRKIEKIATIFWTQINSTLAQVQKFRGDIRSLDKVLYLLYSYQLFEDFITDCQTLKNASKQLAHQFGTQVFQLKKKFGLFDSFTTLNFSRTQLTFVPFNSTNYIINYFAIFQNFTKLRKAAEKALLTLNYEILKAYIAINRQSAIISEEGSLITNKTNALIADFDALVNNFVQLQSGVTQKTLNDLSQRFIALKTRINDSMIVPFSSNYSQFNGFFDQLVTQVQSNQSFNFSIKVIETLLLNATKEFIVGKNNITQELRLYSEKFNLIIDSANELIKKIKINFLNELTLLGADCQKKIADYDTSVSGYLASILDLKQKIAKDVFYALGSHDFLLSVLNKVQSSYTNTLQQIQALNNQHITVIQQDLQFYAAYINSTISTQVSSFPQILVHNFTDLYNQTQPQIDGILSIEGTISSTTKAQLQQLNRIQVKVQQIIDNFNLKINNIYTGFRSISDSFQNFMNIIFLVIETQLNTQVIDLANEIKSNISSLESADNPDLTSLYGSLTQNPHVQIVNYIKAASQQFNSATFIQLQQQIDAIKNKSTAIIQDLQVIKFSKLKQAQNIISLSYIPEAVQTQNQLIHKNQKSVSIPATKISAIVMTGFGGFLVQIEQDFKYDRNISINLPNHNNLDVNIGIALNLTSKITMSYGSSTVQKSSKAIVNFVIQQNIGAINFVPLQYPWPLAQINEINNNNYIQVDENCYSKSGEAPTQIEDPQSFFHQY